MPAACFGCNAGGLLQGQELPPVFHGKFHLTRSLLIREDSLQVKSTQCSKCCLPYLRCIETETILPQGTEGGISTSFIVKP